MFLFFRRNNAIFSYCLAYGNAKEMKCEQFELIQILLFSNPEFNLKTKFVQKL